MDLSHPEPRMSTSVEAVRPVQTNHLQCIHMMEMDLLGEFYNP